MTKILNRWSKLRAKLRSDIGKLLSVEKLTAADEVLWQEFQPPLAAGTPDSTAEELQQQFDRFREAFSEENALEQFSEQVAQVMAPSEQWGMIDALPAEHKANFETIFVRVRKGEGFGAPAKIAVADVLIENVATKLQKSLNEKLSSGRVGKTSLCLVTAAVGFDSLS